MGTQLEHAEVAVRIKLLRIAIFRDNQRAFAERIEVEYKRWNNYERGLPLSLQIAIQLIEHIPGLTLDWIFLGRTDGLSPALARELEKAMAQFDNDVQALERRRRTLFRASAAERRRSEEITDQD